MPCDGLCACKHCNPEQEHLTLLLQEVAVMEQSGRPYTTMPMHAQTHPVDTKELYRQAMEAEDE